MVKRMLLLLFYGLHLSLFFLQSTEAVINNLNFRINSAGQIQAGRDSNQCLSIKADFTTKFKLKKLEKGPIQVFTEKCAYRSSQMFRQVYIDENPGRDTDFAICLEKYYKVYLDVRDTIQNNFYCLFVNDKGLLTISARLKNYSDVVSNKKLHWSINNLQDDGFCEVFDTKNNYLFMNKKGKIRALPEDQIIEFRKLSDVSKISQEEPDPCDPNPCQNNAQCTSNQTNSTICICPDGFNGDLCQNNINDCENNPCANSGKCIDGINSFECKCTDEWRGDLCATKIATEEFQCSATSGAKMVLNLDMEYKNDVGEIIAYDYD